MEQNIRYKIYKNRSAPCGKIIPECDRYAFAVLSRVLQGHCRLTMSDGKRLIICHTKEPYPVWIWTPDDVTDDELNECYRLLKENFTLGKQRFNCKHRVAEHLIRRSAEDGISMSVAVNMLAYGCKKTVEPTARGEVRAAHLKELDIAAMYIEDFHLSTRLDITEKDAYRERARELILSGRLFFLYDESGEVASMCSYSTADDIATVSGVYTPPDKRRHGYAARLVYEVTERILKLGKKPSIYTDGDYPASNACYMKIGYEKAGELCTVG